MAYYNPLGNLLQNPLGSGLYNPQPPQQPSPFMMGSGLYGQPMPQQDPTMAYGMPPQAPQGAAQGGSVDKFTQLMNNPMFQYGMGLLGSSHSANPWGGGLQSYLQSQKFTLDQKKQQQAQEALLVQQQQEAARTAILQQTANQGGQQLDLQRLHQQLLEQQYAEGAPQREAQLGLTGAQTQRYGAETQMDMQKQQLARMQWERQQPVLDAINKTLGVGAPQQQPAQGGMQQQSMSGMGTGKYGTPNALLDGIEKVESNGNPNAVNPQSGAIGAYQFLPTTVNMLAQKGIQFDPKDRNQSRDAADAYFQMLMGEHNNDVNAALAAYGGHVKTDPTPYINKVLTAAGQAQPQQQAQAGGGGNDALAMGRAGALMGLAGIPGGSGMVEYGKMLQPQPVSAGSYQRNPADNSLHYVPDPNKEAELRLQTGKAATEMQAAATKRATTQADDTTAMRAVTSGMTRLAQQADQLMNHKGLEANAGWQGALGLNKIPNSEGRDAAVLLESLKSKLVVGVLADLKKASSNGSSGFGQLSEREGDRLETYTQNLDRAQSLPALKKALGDIKQFADESLGSYQERYNALYGEGKPGVSANGPSAPLGAPPSAGLNGPPAISLDDYLKSKRVVKK